MENRLKQARIRNGLSLREAAKKFGISHEGLRKYENGKIKMDSNQFSKFAKFYNVTVDFILINTSRPQIVFGEIHWHKIPKWA